MHLLQRLVAEHLGNQDCSSVTVGSSILDADRAGEGGMTGDVRSMTLTEFYQQISRRLRHQFGSGVRDVELGELATSSCETVTRNPIRASRGHESRASRTAGCNPRRPSEHSRRSVQFGILLQTNPMAGRFGHE